jgi:uncharacterized Ntn-hydrolase superfamily protein
VIRPSTFSIVAYDPDLQAWGIAVASKFPAVGAVVPWAESGAGAVATQAHANTLYGPKGLDLMRSGTSARDTLTTLLDGDDQRERRQIGLVDAWGEPATFTGTACFDWAGGQTGDHFTVQGNILAGPEVVSAMAEGFPSASGDLADRLLSALRAGDQAGGDRRGRQSAALLIVKAHAGYSGYNDRWLDYRVDDDPEPIPRLAELVDLHRLYFGASPAEDKLRIEGEVLFNLKALLVRQGWLSGPADDQWDEATERALQHFISNENFEDRTDFKKRLIDRPVLDYLAKKFTP